MRKKFNCRGQTLIEVLAGMAMAVLIVAALINLVTASIRSSQVAKNSSQATKYAQEGIEWTRSQRDVLGWDGFITLTLGEDNTKTWCLNNASESLTIEPCLNIGSSIFKRSLTIEKDSDSRVKVKVTVSWKDQAQSEHSSVLDTIFSNTSAWQ